MTVLKATRFDGNQRRYFEIYDQTNAFPIIDIKSFANIKKTHDKPKLSKWKAQNFIAWSEHVCALTISRSEPMRVMILATRFSLNNSHNLF